MYSRLLSVRLDVEYQRHDVRNLGTRSPEEWNCATPLLKVSQPLRARRIRSRTVEFSRPVQAVTKIYQNSIRSLKSFSAPNSFFTPMEIRSVKKKTRTHGFLKCFSGHSHASSRSSFGDSGRAGAATLYPRRVERWEII